MPFLANDRLDPKLSHGDLLDHPRGRAQRHRAVRAAPADASHPRRPGPAVDDRRLRPRHRSGPTSEAATPRNLLGFKDGTANLDVDDGAVMDRHVWVQPDDGEPAWAVGGSLSGRCASSGCSSSSGTAPARRAGGAHRAAARSAARRSTATGEYRHPRLRRRPRRQAHPARRPHPAGQPPHPGDRGEPDPAPGLQLLARASTAPGSSTRAWRSSPTSAACKKGFLAVQRPAQGRAARGVHPAGGRRLLLRAAGGRAGGPVPGRSARRLTLRCALFGLYDPDLVCGFDGFDAVGADVFRRRLRGPRQVRVRARRPAPVPAPRRATAPERGPARARCRRQAALTARTPATHLL